MTESIYRNQKQKHKQKLEEQTEIIILKWIHETRNHHQILIVDYSLFFHCYKSTQKYEENDNLFYINISFFSLFSSSPAVSIHTMKPKDILHFVKYHVSKLKISEFRQNKDKQGKKA